MISAVTARITPTNFALLLLLNFRFLIPFALLPLGILLAFTFWGMLAP